ncbi:MAG: substrate-binding domain-containing protein [Chloroflexota bacterium]|nr:substrate-binding domain-containing protein [Chloroflexota bacterium]
MKKFIRAIGISIALTLATAVVTAQDDPIRIGALIKTWTNPHFVRMGEGYTFAATRYGVEIEVGGTDSESAVNQQVALMESWLASGNFDAFIIAPIRPDSFNALIAEANAQGIPVINVDELISTEITAAEGLTIATRIASNNVRAGQSAAEFIIARLDEGADVAVIEGNPGAQSSIDRVAGFIDAAEFGGLRVVASQPANWDEDTAYEVTTELLNTMPDVRAIFAANDSMGLGAVRAIEDADRAGEILVVSVDAIPDALDAVREGRLAATVAQFPEEMAVLAVEATLKILQGRPIAPEIESPVVVISADNLDDAQSQFGDPTVMPFRIGALTKDLSNSYFRDMVAGYERAEADLGVDLEIGATETEGMFEEQRALLEDWLESESFDGFIVTPFRSTSLNTELAQAADSGIPIINIDELIPFADGLNIITRIASNNVRAGSLAANFVIQQVEAGADVAVIEGAPGTQSSIDRVSGFIDAAEAGGLRVVASQPANWDADLAYTVTAQILDDMPDVRAIFAANDSMGLGAVRAIEDAGRTGEILVVSVDAIPDALDAVRAGRLAATVAQFPDEMAYLAVESMIKVLEGRPIAPFIESPVQLITSENVDQ